MIKVSLPNNRYEEYCKYRHSAYEQFFAAANRFCKKKSYYKNGDIHYWFSNYDYKHRIDKLVSSMKFESIVVNIKKLK